jgi:hypothetical protein
VFIRGFDVSKLLRIDVGLRRGAPLSRANGLAYLELQQHRHRAIWFQRLHTRIRHERIIILRSSEKFWGANPGTDNTNYGVPLVLERRGYGASTGTTQPASQRWGYMSQTTTKVLVASPTQLARGITSHHRCSPPADDQSFFSDSDFTISYMQTLSQPASIGLDCRGISAKEENHESTRLQRTP